MIRHNPWKYNAPPGWIAMSTAPRDGTVIEIQNNWGVAPHFGLAKWADNAWRDAIEENLSSPEGLHLSWREYSGSIDEYIDPTMGRQMTRAYWLHACGRPDLAMKAGNKRLNESIDLTLPVNHDSPENVFNGLIIAVAGAAFFGLLFYALLNI